jgi:hypothetical protein
MENRTEMLRRVTRLARVEPDKAARRLKTVAREWPADGALTAPLLRALGFRDRAVIEEERRALEALTRGPIS